MFRHGVVRLRAGRRSPSHGPVQVERTAVPGAHDAAVPQLAVVQRPTAMCAAISEGNDLVAITGQHQRYPTDVGMAEHAGPDLVRIGDPGPILLAVLEGRGVHADAHGIRQVSA